MVGKRRTINLKRGNKGRKGNTISEFRTEQRIRKRSK
jgi:hypothetical protein